MGVVIGDGDEGMTVRYDGNTVHISGAVVGGISVGPDGVTISEPSRDTVHRRGQTFTGIDVDKIVADAMRGTSSAKVTHYNDGVACFGGGTINVTNSVVNGRYVDNETIRGNEKL